MAKTKKFTDEELQVIASIQSERGTTRKSAVRYFQKNRDTYMLRGTKAAVAPVVDVKQRAANDKPEQADAKHTPKGHTCKADAGPGEREQAGRSAPVSVGWQAQA